jgi:2'-hydroxyisoflavone reductase
MGRFTYWPVRLARGGEVLVPGTPDNAVQLIDVRDLAQWIVLATERRLTGTFDAIGPSFARGEFLTRIAAAVGASCTFTWADRAFLEGHDIKRWSGPRSLPLWLPLPEFAGFSTRDTSPARERRLDRAAARGDRTRYFGMGTWQRWSRHRPY